MPPEPPAAHPPPAVPARALVVGAHPDDVDFGAGGLLATWARAGCDITVACITDGDSGGFDPSVPRDQVPHMRREEQRRAAEVLGARRCVFLGRPDGFVVADQELRRDLARLIRQIRPDAVVTHSPERNYRFVFMYHPDHLATGAAVLAAVYPDARNAFAFPELVEEGLQPWSVPRVWLFGGPSGDPPNTAVDVTDVFELKVRACEMHGSQLAMLDRGVAEELGDLMGTTAREHGLPNGRVAEAYQVLETA